MASCCEKWTRTRVIIGDTFRIYQDKNMFCPECGERLETLIDKMSRKEVADIMKDIKPKPEEGIDVQESFKKFKEARGKTEYCECNLPAKQGTIYYEESIKKCTSCRKPIKPKKFGPIIKSTLTEVKPKKIERMAYGSAPAHEAELRVKINEIIERLNKEE